MKTHINFQTCETSQSKSVPWLLRPGNSLRAACETSIMNASVIVVRFIQIGSNSSGVDIKLSVDRLVKNNTDHIDIAVQVSFHLSPAKRPIVLGATAQHFVQRFKAGPVYNAKI